MAAVANPGFLKRTLKVNLSKEFLLRIRLRCFCYKPRIALTRYI